MGMHRKDREKVRYKIVCVCWFCFGVYERYNHVCFAQNHLWRPKTIQPLFLSLIYIALHCRMSFVVGIQLGQRVWQMGRQGQSAQTRGPAKGRCRFHLETQVGLFIYQEYGWTGPHPIVRVIPTGHLSFPISQNWLTDCGWRASLEKSRRIDLGGTRIVVLWCQTLHNRHTR